ncbi:hypothetical protein N7493_011195 [Penicillium malachiteum]|uniref:Uncharacterized protein n=1 Tax=Penicillium malachiteum TaxID=1324776 RepID=A0AAD6HBN6_9EURO|nr:hypothetical protein N7493_011195 [Penicillium malachiteum]
MHGEDGFREILQEISGRSRARLDAAESEETKQKRRELLAPFIQVLDSVFTFRGAETEDVIEEGLAPHRGSLPKVDRAIDLLEFRWVEKPELQGADAADVARYFNEMTLPQGLNTSACLIVTPASMESILSSPLPSSAPFREGQTISFIVSVSSRTSPSNLPPFLGLGDDIAGADFKGYLNVAVERMLDEFYPIVALQMFDLHELVVGFRHDNDIWCAGHRWGIRHYEES